ncbi:alpha-tocopherol transfer protein isoform X2 [Daktulosphaira vitifoliae]|uniref:alpha-tocopherol transfer protein isoform X2 n=1 Tax=Daktulosphaira vitifoliae TaxID=58002 RepID=UPI0021A9C533|nr:alpha-tocopherol transfer protein isoform X2 [Daktulosphaira vitifoliae]
MIVPKGCEMFLSDLDKIPCMQIGEFTLRLELDDDLSPELQEVAEKQLRETPENQEKAIAELRRLLEQDKTINVPLDKNSWLIRFLRPTKYYPGSAYKLMKQYFDFKLKHANVFKDLVPRNEKNIFEHNILTVLPKRDQNGRRILVIELGKKWKHKKCSLDEVFKGAVLYLEAAMLEPATQVAGAQVIFDMDGLSLQQTWQFSPPFAKRIVDWLQDSIPARIKGIHIVNQPVLFNVVFNLFKPFLREKLRSRIIFHGTDRVSLHKHLSPSCLPKHYDGTLEIPLITGLQWYEVLLLAEKEYETLNQYGTVSKK